MCFPSCPALGRASTFFFLSWKAKEDVDGRDKPGHDDGEVGAFMGILKNPFSCGFALSRRGSE
jgi:hypothetical protein